jgi:DNA invertase Pin-like site-specific DNA recombinase
MRGIRATVNHAAVYVRLSQDRTGDSLGISRQAELCEKVAAERGWPVAEIYEERNISAYNGARRPAFERLLEDIEAGRRDAVIAVDQDRLARRLGELNRLIELCADKRVPIVLLSGELDTTTADGVLRAHILGAVAQNESAKKSERIKRQRDQAAKLGRFTGGTRPYGFETDGVTIRPSEAKVVREATRRLLTGESLRSVAMDFNARDIATCKGGPWRPNDLKSILIKPRLAGLCVHRGEVIGEAEWKPIVDRDDHQRLVRMLTDASRTSSQRGRPSEHLLSRLCRCGRCGATLWHHTKVSGSPAYKCPDKGKGGCNGLTIKAEPLEELIAAAVAHRLDSKQTMRALSKRGRSPAGGDNDVVAIEHDLEQLAADFGAGTISRREWLAARQPLEQRRDVALASLDEHVDLGAIEVFQRGKDVSTVWRRLDLDRQRAVLNLLIDRIVVNPAAVRGMNAFDPDRVDVVWRV